MMSDYKHIFICGQTGSGKTYLSNYLANQYDDLLFFNSQHYKLKGDYLNLNGQSDEKVLISALEKKYRINYLPAENIEIARKELNYLVELLKNSERKRRKLVIIDEVADYAPQSMLKESAVYFLARRGRGHNLKCVFISQTPADVAKSITKQCEHHIIFKFNFYDEAYFTRFKIPSKEINDLLNKNKAYSFIYLSGNKFDLHSPIDKI